MASQDKPSEHRQPTNSELFSSAKYVAEAAQASFNNQGDKVDKAKAAGAAEDLLGAASQYGKLEERGMGQYVEKAENYLHEYGHKSDSTANKTTTPDAKPEDKQEAPAEGKKSEEGGFGGAFKMAQGFLK